MPKTGRRHQGFRVVFRGESETLARAFPDLRAEFADGNTALVGTIRDQSELLGMLERADSLGFALVSLNPTETEHVG
jgi:hypothetical protein